MLIPCNICETVPSTYWKAGFKVKFVDISRKDFLPDESAIIKILEENKNIKVLHYNHTYGFVDLKQELFFKRLKTKFPDIIIIDDRCLCIPELDLRENHYADMYLYSTGVSKIVDIGYGGFAHIKDKFKYIEHTLPYSEEDEFNFVAHIRSCQNDKKSVDKKIATCNWLKITDNNNCADYFKQINGATKEILAHKKELNRIYNSLNNKLDDSYNQWRFQILVGCQEKCLSAIFENGLFASKHYKSLGNGYFGDEITPNADWLSAHIINLFNDYKFDRAKAKKMVEILSSILC